MRNFIERELPRLLELIYAAALEPARWAEVLEALPASFGGASGILQLCVNGATLPTFMNFGSDPAFIASYALYYSSINPYPRFGFGNVPTGQVAFATEFAPAEAIEPTEFHNDWMKPQGITADHLTLSLVNDGENVALLSVAPHATVFHKDRKGYVKRLELLKPHIMRAFEINRRTASAGHLQIITDVMFETLRVAALLVDRHGRVLRATVEAEALLRQVGHVVTLDRAGTLRATQPTSDSLFAKAIASISVTRQTVGPVRLESDPPGQGQLAWIIPLPAQHSKEHNIFRSAIADLADRPVALVLLTPIDHKFCVQHEMIAAAFRLSSAEARLVAALVGGETLDTYAKRNGLSRNTVRNQLSQVFDRTGTSRQAELVAKVITALAAVSGGRTRL